jgi:2-iminobutanoate/2-iminopropanoate deaminase
LINPNDMLADASRYGDLVFTAGFLGDAPGDDFAADVENSLDSLDAALEASGAGFDTLLKVNVYLTDWTNWETFNSIYHRRIEKYGLPPRTTVEVGHLGFDAPIEIAVIAHVRTPAP